MQASLIADAEIRYSDKYPAVNRLSDVPGAGGLALCCERRRADRDMLVGQLLVRPRLSTVDTALRHMRKLPFASLRDIETPMTGA
jgi:hypothetical protein